MYIFSGASLVAQLVKNPPAMRKTWVWSLGWEDPLEKGKATHSSILAWRIPWTTVHGVTKSQTWLTNFHTHTHTHIFSASFQIGFAVIAFMNIGPCKIHEKFVVCSFGIIKNSAGTSPVVQWLRICLAMRRTLVWSLVGEWRLSPLMPQLENPSAAAKDPMCCN